jgi:hypothetical protein
MPEPKQSGQGLIGTALKGVIQLGMSQRRRYSMCGQKPPTALPMISAMLPTV